MAGKSKKKGSAHESAVAKILSAWADEEFKRVPSSGALRWAGASWVYGDLLPPESLPVVIECKHHHEVSVEDLLWNGLKTSGLPKLVKWWDQVEDDAHRCFQETGTHVEPLLCWKRDYGRHRLCVWEAFFTSLEEHLGVKMDHIAVCIPDHDTFVMLDLMSFLSTVPVEELREVITT